MAVPLQLSRGRSPLLRVNKEDPCTHLVTPLQPPCTPLVIHLLAPIIVWSIPYIPFDTLVTGMIPPHLSGTPLPSRVNKEAPYSPLATHPPTYLPPMTPCVILSSGMPAALFCHPTQQQTHSKKMQPTRKSKLRKGKREPRYEDRRRPCPIMFCVANLKRLV